MGNEQSRTRYEADDNEKINDVVRKYLQEHDPSLLNTPYGYRIAIIESSGKQTDVSGDLTVKDLITKYGTDTIQITPGAGFGMNQ